MKFVSKWRDGRCRRRWHSKSYRRHRCCLWSSHEGRCRCNCGARP